MVTYFPNFSEICYKKMFAYFQVALGQSWTVCIGKYWCLMFRIAGSTLRRARGI